MRSSARVLDVLMKLLEFSFKVGIPEGCTVVSEIALDDDTIVTCHTFETTFGMQCFMGIQGCLKLDVDESTCVVTEYGSTEVLVVHVLLSKGFQSSSFE